MPPLSNKPSHVIPLSLLLSSRTPHLSLFPSPYQGEGRKGEVRHPGLSAKGGSASGGDPGSIQIDSGSRAGMTLLIFGTCLFFVIWNLIIPPVALADNLRSSDFRIQMGTINSGGGNQSGGGFKLANTVGQTAQGQFDVAGYRVRAGFQYIHSIIPFTFSVDKIAVNFGTVLPSTIYTDTNVLTVHAGGAYGYVVKAIENQLLTSSGSTTIPNTTCDPALTCSLSDATPWTSTLSYGFGYNMSGDDTDTGDFVNSTYFRPFPANSLAQNPVTIMSKSGVTRASVATVTYQLIVSPTQPAGTYRNIIQYLAIPSF
ncbi:hypothetical protein HYU91_02395 [Candidatus Collierbacteria bacterium]|nr:hypothetical protein [Candidatus Collierbacteria bacterium]